MKRFACTFIIIYVLFQAPALFAQADTPAESPVPSDSPAASPAPSAAPSILQGKRSPIPISVGIDPVRLFLALGNGGAVFHVSTEVAFLEQLSAVLDFHTGSYKQQALEWWLIGIGLSARWYLLGEGFTAPANAPEGLFMQLGLSYLEGKGAWPYMVAGENSNFGLVYGLGWKITSGTANGLYAEPMLGYRSAFGMKVGSGFWGGVSIGWVF